MLKDPSAARVRFDFLSADCAPSPESVVGAHVALTGTPEELMLKDPSAARVRVDFSSAGGKYAIVDALTGEDSVYS
jgi:hypothetical protein